MALVLVPRASRSPLFDGLRSAAVLYIAITGVVSALLLLSGLQEELGIGFALAALALVAVGNRLGARVGPAR